MITNAYAPAAAPPPAARPMFSYNLAVALLAEDLDVVKTLAPNPDKEGMSKCEIIRAITGHDPFLPPGHSADHDVLSAAPLMALTKPQLQIIAGSLPGKPPIGGLDKPALVDLILSNAGQETGTPHIGSRQRKRGMKLEIYRGDLRGPSFPDSGVDPECLRDLLRTSDRARRRVRRRQSRRGSPCTTYEVRDGCGIYRRNSP